MPNSPRRNGTRYSMAGIAMAAEFEPTRRDAPIGLGRSHASRQMTTDIPSAESRRVGRRHAASHIGKATGRPVWGGQSPCYPMNTMEIQR